jgi:hypothetical protein
MNYEKSLNCELPCRCLSPCCRTHWGDPGQGSSKRISRVSFRLKLPKKNLYSHDRWLNFILHILGQKCKFRTHSRRWPDLARLNLTQIILNLASSVVDPELFISDPVPDPDPDHIQHSFFQIKNNAQHLAFFMLEAACPESCHLIFRFFYQGSFTLCLWELLSSILFRTRIQIRNRNAFRIRFR